ncbi:MAG: hypothetical protein LCH85_24475 [Chloroflexi bacterium]|nr:hypothetical protein [Chloroflexota bacterium]
MKRWMLLFLVVVSLALPQASSAAEQQCFEQTGFCIEGRFLQYWQQNGGLQVFGYPLGIAQDVYNQDSQQSFLTQQFERARFELHPEFAAPYDVLLGRLGDDLLRYRNIDSPMLPRETGSKASCLWFETTGHNVCNQANGLGFMSYWQNHGLNDPKLDSFGSSLQLFGYPLTEPTMETNANGDTVLTQQFERARFEWHPNQPDQFKVLLGLVGKETTALRYGESSSPSHLTQLDSRVFFTANDGVHGQELWVSDGSNQGTRLVKDINPTGSANPYKLTAAAGQLFFVVSAGNNEQLWVTNGTEAGTTMVYSFSRPAAEEPAIVDLAPVASGVIVMGYTAEFGIEPWFSNGSNAGTALIRDINPGKAGSEIKVSTCCSYSFATEFTPMGSSVAFMAKTGNAGNQIWLSDGSAENTRQISTFEQNNELVTELERLNNDQIIAAVQQPDVVQIVKIELATGKHSQLTSHGRFHVGTRLMVTAYDLTNIADQVYYTVFDTDYHVKLWKLDAQANPTQLDLANYQIKRIIPSSFQTKLHLQLSNNDGSAAGLAVWDGKQLQRLSLLDFQQVAYNGQYLFGLTGTNSPYRLYANASANQNLGYIGSGMHYLSNSPSFAQVSRFSSNQGIFLSLPDMAHGFELWYSDGNTLRMVKDIRP